MSDSAIPVSKPRDPELTSVRGWLVVASVSIISFLIMGSSLASLGVYLPVLQSAFQWSEQEVGIIAAALLVGMSFSSIAAGWILNKIGSRKLLMGGIIITAAGMIAGSYADSLLHLSIAMGVVGGGVGAATIVPGATIINRWFIRRRGIAMAFFIGSIVIAAAVIPPITEILIQARGWRSAFITYAAAIGVVGLGLAMFVDLPPDQFPKASNDAIIDDSGHSLSGMSVREGLGYTRFWLLILALTLLQLSINGILYNVISYFIAEGFSSGKAVSIYSIANLCGLPGLFISGALADRFGAKRIMPIACVIIALGTFSLLGVNADSKSMFLAVGIFVILWGLASGLPSQIGPIILAELVGMRAFPSLIGIKGAVVSLVGAFAPVLVGVLYGVQGSYRLPFLISGLLALVAAPIFLLIQRRANI